jgi:phosphomannomutase
VAIKYVDERDYMPTLMTGVSGVRGIFGDGLDVAVAERFAHAFGKWCAGPVIVGRDSRVSGPVIADAVFSGLGKAGVGAVDLGIVPTPTVEMAVIAREAAGGIIITASHNPGQWNGLKFLGSDGVFLDAEEGAEFLAAYEATGDLADIPVTGFHDAWNTSIAHHVDAVLDLDLIDRYLIASRGFTVCLDAVNGGGGPACMALLDHLGCTVRGINLDPTGVFTHNPEPVPSNLGDLCAHVSDTGADIGFAVDPDADRLSLVDEHGTAIGEEYTLAIVADYLMERGVQTGACNLSTSRMIDDAAARHGATVHRSAVGEINVVKLMRAVDAGIGGEGNGGIILPALHHGRDSLVGIALILQIMAECNASLSELAARFPRYTLLKDRTPCGGDADWREGVRGLFPDDERDERDGVKVIFPDAWVHVRESNTEPIVRIMAEAPTDERAHELVEMVRGVV